MVGITKARRKRRGGRRYFRGLGALGVWLRIALCLTGLGWAGQSPALDIHEDLGGRVERRFAAIETLRSRGERIRILGTCISACTLYLGLPGTCVAPGARLGFHGPRTAIGLPLPRRDFDDLTSRMAAYYPGEIRRWFWQEARMTTATYIVLTGRQAIRMGARACGSA